MALGRDPVARWVRRAEEGRAASTVVYLVLLAAVVGLLVDRFLWNPAGRVTGGTTPEARGPGEVESPVLHGAAPQEDSLPIAVFEIVVTVQLLDGPAPRAAPGAAVAAIERVPGGASRAVATAQTDDAGRARLRVASVPVTILARAEGVVGDSALVESRPASGTAQVALTLRRFGVLTVAAKDAGGRALPGCAVTITYPHGTGLAAALFSREDTPRSPRVTRRTQPDGSCVLESVVPGADLWLEVQHADHGTSRRELSPFEFGEERRVEVQLETRASIRFALELPGGAPLLGGFATILPTAGETLVTEATRDLELEGEQLVRGLGAGAWRLIVAAKTTDGWSLYVREFSLIEGEEKSLGVLELEGQSVDLRVTGGPEDTEGRLLKVWIYSLLPTEDPARRALGASYHVEVPLAGRRARCTGLHAGHWSVSVSPTKPWSTVPDTRYLPPRLEFDVPGQESSYTLNLEAAPETPTGALLLRLRGVPAGGESGVGRTGTACALDSRGRVAAVLPTFPIRLRLSAPLGSLPPDTYRILAWGGGGMGSATASVTEGKTTTCEIDLATGTSARIDATVAAPGAEEDWFPLRGSYFLEAPPGQDAGERIPLGTFQVGTDRMLRLEVPPGETLVLEAAHHSGALARSVVRPLSPGAVHTERLTLAR